MMTKVSDSQPYGCKNAIMLSLGKYSAQLRITKKFALLYAISILLMNVVNGQCPAPVLCTDATTAGPCTTTTEVVETGTVPFSIVYDAATNGMNTQTLAVMITTPAVPDCSVVDFDFTLDYTIDPSIPAGGVSWTSEASFEIQDIAGTVLASGGPGLPGSANNGIPISGSTSGNASSTAGSFTGGVVLSIDDSFDDANEDGTFFGNLSYTLTIDVVEAISPDVTTMSVCDDGDASTTNDMQEVRTCDGAVCGPCAGVAACIDPDPFTYMDACAADVTSLDPSVVQTNTGTYTINPATLTIDAATGQITGFDALTCGDPGVIYTVTFTGDAPNDTCPLTTMFVVTPPACPPTVITEPTICAGDAITDLLEASCGDCPDIPTLISCGADPCILPDPACSANVTTAVVVETGTVPFSIVYDAATNGMNTQTLAVVIMEPAVPDCADVDFDFTLDYTIDPSIPAGGISWTSEASFEILDLAGTVLANGGPGLPGSANNGNPISGSTTGSSTGTAVNFAGGVVLSIEDSFDDANEDGTFFGNLSYTLTITVPTVAGSVPGPVIAGGPATLTWYDALTGGTAQGTGTTLDPTGTTAEEGAFDANTAGTYTYYAECTCASCSSERVPLVFTVLDAAAPFTYMDACAVDATTLSPSVAQTVAGAYTIAPASLTIDAMTGAVTGFDAVACTDPVTTYTVTFTPDAPSSACLEMTTFDVTPPACPPTVVAEPELCSGATVTPLEVACAACAVGVSTVTWYDAATAGTAQGTGATLDPTGTTAEEGAFDASTAGTYTYYAECDCDGCPSERVAVTITVLDAAIPFTFMDVCAVDVTTLNPSAAQTIAGTYTIAPASLVIDGATGEVTGFDAIACTAGLVEYTVTFTPDAPSAACLESTIFEVTPPACPPTVINEPEICEGAAVNPADLLEVSCDACPDIETVIDCGTDPCNLPDPGCSANVVTTLVVESGTIPFSIVYDAATNGSNTQTLAVVIAEPSVPACANVDLDFTLNYTIDPSIPAGGISWTSEASFEIQDLAGAILASGGPGLPGSANNGNPISGSTTGSASALASNFAGGVVLSIEDSFDDANEDGTFFGTLDYTLTINVPTVSGTIPGPVIPGPAATVTWYDTATAGTAQGTGATLDPTGTTAEEGAFLSATPGTYTYYAECECDGCPSERTAVTITVNENPTVAPQSGEVCMGPAISSIMLDGVPSGGSGTYTTHAWTITNDGGTGATDAANLSNATSQIVTFTGTGLSGGTVTLSYTVTDDNGCSETLTTTVGVNDNPMAAPMTPTNVCEGASTTVDGMETMGSGAFTSFSWAEDAANPSTASGYTLSNTTTTVVTVDATNATPGLVNLIFMATDDNGCTISAMAQIEILGLPVVTAGTYGPFCNITTAPAQVLTGLGNGTATFPSGGTLATAVYSGTGVSDNGDNTFDFDPVAAGPGTHTVTYTVTDSFGCTNSETTTIEVVDCEFDVTNNFAVTDPCVCNGDQGTNNGPGDGTFAETVTIVGPADIMIRLASETVGTTTIGALPATMAQTGAGTGDYEISFDHIDRDGFNIDLFEFSIDGGITWFTVPDGAGAPLMISNVCAYPILTIAYDQFCEDDAPDVTLSNGIAFDLTVVNPSPIFTPDPATSASFTIGGVPATIADLDALGAGAHTIVGTYVADNGTGDNGTAANPAIGLDNSACPIVVETILYINAMPEPPVVVNEPQICDEELVDPLNLLEVSCVCAANSDGSIPVEETTWWNLPAGGIQQGTGLTFDPTGTNAQEGTFDNTTPGVYTYYAQCHCDDCTSDRVAVTIEVLAIHEPTITCLGDIEIFADNDQCGTEYDFVPPTLDGFCTGLVLTNNLSADNTFTQFLPVGSTTIVWTAVDDCVNMCAPIPTCSQTITVRDVTPPTFICPNDMTVYTDECETTLWWEKPIIDNCNIMGFEGSFDIANWSSPVDDGGAAAGTFTGGASGVTLDPTSAPVSGYVETCIVVPSAGLISFDWSAIMTNGVDTNGGAFNNDEASYLLNGVEMILASGMLNSLSGSTTYLDVAAGDVLCFRVKSNSVAYYTLLTITNFQYLPGFQFDVTAPVTPDSFEGAGDGDLVGPGVYEIVCEVTDAAGNQDWCSFRITVLDSEPIRLTCADDVVVNILDPISCDTSVYFAPPVLTDNCPIVGAPVQISGPISASAPDVNDGEMLVPGLYEAVYEYFDGVNTYTCTVNIDVNAYENMAMACKNINVSLDEYCQAEITPFTVLSGEEMTLGCESNYVVTIEDPHGVIIDNIVDDTYLNQTLTYTVCVIGGGNCCWGYLTIEDKLPPTITCVSPVTIPCNALNDYVPEVSNLDNCSNTTEIILINEEVSDNVVDCDPDINGKVYRTFIAVDGNGAQSEPCTVEIILERVQLNGIDYPSDITKLSADPLCCDATNWVPDENGYPDPVYGIFMGGPTAGSGTGVPTFAGSDLYPSVPDEFCNVFTDYTDQVYAQTDCVTKIQRTWTVREWHCSGETVTSGFQLLEIVDKSGPVVEPIDTLFSTTSWDCVGQINLPPIEAHDDCSADLTYTVAYPGGFIETNGGLIELPIDTHTVTYTVFDGCYNQTMEEVVVVVKDHTAPVAICETHTVVSVPTAGSVEVWAESFDDGSWDDCYIDQILVRRMDSYCDEDDMEFDDSVSFCCEDVGRDEPIMVVLRVIDKGGYYNECMVNVTVQDKIDPSISCPPDVTLFCTDDFDFNNPNPFFGEPTITDNCANPDNVDNMYSDGLSQCNTGVIYRTILIYNADGTVASSCEQKITILPDDPFDRDDVNWPADYLGTGCGAGDLDPEDLDPPYNYPTFLEDECDLVGYNYEDEVFEFVPGGDACIKILRHWKVINWCDLDQDPIEHTQVLKVDDQMGPDIMGNCEAILVESADGSCQGARVQRNISASDECTVNLDWSYTVDWFNDGTIDVTETGAMIDSIYPVGRHTIVWTVLDKCGNVDFCEQDLEVRNTKKPVAVCISGLSVDLVAMDLLNNDSLNIEGAANLDALDSIPDGKLDSEMAILWASEFDASSGHPCGNEVVVSFSIDTSDTVLVLDCDDVGIVDVDLYVTDTLTGEFAFCSTFVNVTDNNQTDICTGTTVPRADVTGLIISETGEPIMDVQVELLDTGIDPAMTEVNGNYAFPAMPLGGSYIIEPTKNDDYLNGVSTLDLVLIQKHILGEVPLNSAYKLIAADANDNQSVTAIDLIHLRKLILGVYNELPNNDSWKFISAEFDFIDSNNPWTEAIPGNYDISSLDNDMLIDFIGVKVGDVNNSASLTLNENSIENRNRGIQFNYDLNEIDQDNLMPIYFDTEHEIYGFQVSLKSIDTKSPFVELVSGQMVMTDLNYHITEKGELNISYSTSELTSYNSVDPLFYVKLNKDVSSISLANAMSANESYGTTLLPQSITVGERELTNIIASSIRPNPWSTSMDLELVAEKDEIVKLEVFDLAGKLYYERDMTLSEGSNVVELSHDDISAYGTFIVKISGTDWTLTKRTIHLR